MRTSGGQTRDYPTSLMQSCSSNLSLSVEKREKKHISMKRKIPIFWSYIIKSACKKPDHHHHPHTRTIAFCLSPSNLR